MHVACILRRRRASFDREQQRERPAFLRRKKQLSKSAGERANAILMRRAIGTAIPAHIGMQPRQIHLLQMMQVNYTCVKSDSSRPLVSFFFSSAGGRVFTTTEAERLCRCPSCCADVCWRDDAFVLPTFYSDLLLMETRWIVGQAGAAAYVCYVLLVGAGWGRSAVGLLRRV